MDILSLEVWPSKNYSINQAKPTLSAEIEEWVYVGAKKTWLIYVPFDAASRKAVSV